MRTFLGLTSTMAFILATSGATASGGMAASTAYRPAPYGPGTENAPSRVGDDDRVREGAEAGVQLGGAFSDAYGAGLGARLGYSFSPGVYVGAAYSHYFGQIDATHADFFGGELGYKFFPTVRWELRPYAFLGPAFISTRGLTRSDLAFQPSLLTAYHVGAVYFSVEARGLVTPDPQAFALLGGVGAGLW